MNITFTKQTPHNNRIYNPGATIIVSEKEGMKYISAGHAIENVSAVIRAAGGGTTGVAQVNSDWLATTGVAEILNKPTIPAAQVSSDWNALTGIAQILNKPSLDFDKYEWWNLQGVSRVSNYGALYNWYAATDARNISSSDEWIIPSKVNFETLDTFLGGNTVAGGKLKELNALYWDSPNTDASNLAKFNARGSSHRNAGGFYILNRFAWLWTSTANGDTFWHTYRIAYNSAATAFVSGLSAEGKGIRFVNNTTSLLDGESGTYTGNDGKIYRTICIGTQEWLADNLYETKFRNGDIIPNVTEQSLWNALTTGGMCYYNNDKANAYTDSPVTIPIHSHDLLELQMTGGEIIATATSTGAMITVTVTGVTPASIGATTSYSATLGNGVLTSIPITHNLNTRKIIAMVYNTTTFEVIMCDVVVTSVNTVTLGFSVAPATAQYTINIIGG